MKKVILKKGFNASRAYTEVQYYLKDLPKPAKPNRTYMMENHFKRGFQCLFGLTRRVGAIERLIQTFDAKQDLYGENHLKRGFQFTVQRLMDLHGFSAIERLT